MTATSRRAVPIPPACDSREPREFVRSSTNVQRRTLNVQRPMPDARSSSRGSCRCRFVDRADDCPNDNHLDQAARAAVQYQLPRKWLHRVKAQAHADRRDFQKDTEPDSPEDAATGETVRVDHHEGKNNQCLADNDPVK